MQEKLNKIKERFEELSKKLSSSQLAQNPNEYQKVAKEHKDLEEIVLVGDDLTKSKKEIKENEEMLKDGDSEFIEIAKEEIEKLKIKVNSLEEKLKFLFLPKDPNDNKNVIIEIRPAAGGDESSLFTEEIFKMYSIYAQKNNWTIEILSSSSSEGGGYKEMIFRIQGNGAYSKLKYESGVHRVQRVPKTEAKGRIHTSTVTVAVLPEAEEIELEIKPEEIKVDVFRSSGPGGQSVNTTDSAVRITHIPTGLVVSCQDEKSQLKNKDKALRILRSRLLVQKEEEEQKKLGDARKLQIGTGDRSEKIRTYNFPQSRITDHRINYTTHALEKVLSGELDELINALIEENQKALLSKNDN
jgi:peptide chain release factor 1